MNGSTTITRAKRKASRPLSPQALFLQGFFKHPVMVGSIIPSSRKLIRKMLGRVDWDNTKLFVEYGPGVGTFCRAVLDRLGPDAKYIAIDTNPDFVAYLRQSIVDPRFSAIHGSAEDVNAIVADHGEDHADYVLSGLPFSTLPAGVGERIAAATQKVLRPGGQFLVYQFNPNVRNFLTPHFQRIDHDMEWWNMPPAQLWWAWKDEAAD
ncbi:methyltransferase domain-containing protein [Sphingomonas koreensis]|jgi:phospholipid N-methyltransferase|uniref:Methyltransferase n=1 Tax=Sphingomonas koreensis TaxID=93064 RepID=A0A1L6J726_9SPHN|nr:methyltransferase domain-containing protein [Sphingomonas koreensis]APR51637.1 methyltransferase [Sphingomonas koreensis]MDC7811796.1 methyltransferase domain-containing protein [Sphingomonas koreensis]PJI88878.1 phospholipid N-methyltransferase [Sphingomonas koreensis]RSU19118.1 methyltransferase domain-containing protein [Sphingomonas koreensis]RSU21250.1 methyltransferase domain-containing protein [Sphingomonas koreensis]